MTLAQFKKMHKHLVRARAHCGGPWALWLPAAHPNPTPTFFPLPLSDCSPTGTLPWVLPGVVSVACPAQNYNLFYKARDKEALVPSR
jgi:hypothetical protein